ncbi:MAG: hypothetical protein ABID67_00295 [Candidatus Nealsonbacteria bacterium]
MFKKFKHLILIFVIISIFLPTVANAFIISEIVAIPDTILGGISEANVTTFRVVITFFIFYIIGVVSLLLSSNFLQSFISQQDQWMTNLEPMTQAGWNFTVGLSNMLLILIFLVIAFGFILKIENIQSKKALPKLLGVAVLINFSWVFVRIFTDISHVIYNTLLPSESIFSMVIDVFLGPAVSIITTMMTAIGALVVSWAIPIGNVFGQITFAVMFTLFFLPNIILWTFQAIFFFLLSGTFFTFAFLFAARVFVIQTLIILSPLAFLSLILPQTKSFWSQWYKALLEWLLLGVFFLFFLVLGFSTIKELSPTVGETRLPGALNMFQIGGYIAYYFAIFIYMAVIMWIGKSFIPKGAKALIDFGTGIVGTVLTRGLKPLGMAAKKNLTNFATAQKGKEDRLANASDAVRARYKRRMSPMNRFAMGAGGLMRRGVEFGHRTVGTTLNEENSKEIKNSEAEASKISTPELLASEIKKARKSGNKNRELAFTANGITRNPRFKRILEAEGAIDKSTIANLAEHANTAGRSDQTETLARGYMRNLSKKELENMVNFSEEDREKYGSAKGMLFKKAKGDEIDQIEEGAWLNEEGKMDESVMKNIKGNQIGKLAIRSDAFANDLNKFTEENGEEFFEKYNPGPMRYLDGNAAQDLGTGLKPVPRRENKAKEKNDKEKQIKNTPEGWTETKSGIAVPSDYSSSQAMRAKHIEQIKKHGARYNQLKNKGVLSNTEKLERDELLKKMKENNKKIKKTGGELSAEDLGDLNLYKDIINEQPLPPE